MKPLIIIEADERPLVIDDRSAIMMMMTTPAERLTPPPLPSWCCGGWQLVTRLPISGALTAHQLITL